MKNKVFKKLAAAGAAIMMAVTGMAMSASAYPDTSTWPSFSLHYIPSAPSSANLTEQIIGTNSTPHTFQVSHKGQLTIDTYVSSLSNTTLTFKGFVYDTTIYNGSSYGAWGLAVTKTRATTGFSTPTTGYYDHAQVGNAAQVRVKLTANGNSNYYYPSGKTTAY